MTDKLATLPPVKTAKLPVAYEHAKDALLKCSTIDECAEWKNKAEAIASYARQADDETLLNTAIKIKARAIRRGGALLKEIEPAPGTRTDLQPRGGAPPRLTRESVATSAKLSPDQRKEWLRVASIPDEEFERLVEAPGRAPTVTELAKLGTKSAPPKPPSTAHLHGRDPEDFKASTRAQGALSEFLSEVSKIDPAVAVRGTAPNEYQETIANARAARDWLKKLLVELERSVRS